MNKITAFLKDVKVELAKVSWPTKKNTFNYSLIVVITSVVVAFFLGGLDLFFSFILNKIL